MPKQRRRVMRALKINEISGVDVPAQEGAVAVIMKRKGDPGYRPDAKDPKKRGRLNPQTDELDVEKGAALTSADDGHTHLIALVGHGGDEINSGMTTWVDEHAHPWIRNVDGDIVIGEAHAPDGVSHAHRIGELSKLVGKEAAGDPGTVGNEEDTTMTDKTKEQTDAEAAVVDLTVQLERANQVAALNDAEKSYLAALPDGLAGSAATAFLAKSADERKVELDAVAKAATDSDPVVYTTLDGVELRKSAGDGFIAMAKSNDEMRKRLEKAEAVAETAAYEKRVEVEVGHLPGDVETRVAMLKAIDSIEDKDKREAALNALKAQNAAMSKSFETLGHAVTPVPGSPADELDKLAKKRQDENSGMSFEKAYDDVVQTEAGAELYAEVEAASATVN